MHRLSTAVMAENCPGNCGQRRASGENSADGLPDGSWVCPPFHCLQIQAKHQYYCKHQIFFCGTLFFGPDRMQSRFERTPCILFLVPLAAGMLLSKDRQDSCLNTTQDVSSYWSNSPKPAGEVSIWVRDSAISFLGVDSYIFILYGGLWILGCDWSVKWPSASVSR